MSWSLNIGSVAGTAIRIHITFLLFLAWIFGVEYIAGGPQAAWNGLLFIVLLFLCVLLHEFGHIFTARAFGVRTPDVILLPIGGVSRLERIPEKPSEEFLIPLPGPRSTWSSPCCWCSSSAPTFPPITLPRSRAPTSA